VRLLGNSIVDQRYIEHGMANVTISIFVNNWDNVDSVKIGEHPSTLKIESINDASDRITVTVAQQFARLKLYALDDHV